ncbi:hypothetical protein PINS_up015160 [Pythium insidiosum]|nr:hypothetical protein PINS_up015160 [Pythium insidiosum]
MSRQYREPTRAESQDDESTLNEGARLHEHIASIGQCQVKHDFVGENADELHLKKGEIIQILSKDNPDWWLGETCDGTRGLFPANFVDELAAETSIPGDEQPSTTSESIALESAVPPVEPDQVADPNPSE